MYLRFALLRTICALLEGYQKVIIVKQHEIYLFLDCSVGSHEESYNHLEIIITEIYSSYGCRVSMKTP